MNNLKLREENEYLKTVLSLYEQFVLQAIPVIKTFIFKSEITLKDLEDKKIDDNTAQNLDNLLLENHYSDCIKLKELYDQTLNPNEEDLLEELELNDK